MMEEDTGGPICGENCCGGNRSQDERWTVQVWSGDQLDFEHYGMTHLEARRTLLAYARNPEGVTAVRLVSEARDWCEVWPMAAGETMREGTYAETVLVRA
jgi:hypothetical protein